MPFRNVGPHRSCPWTRLGTGVLETVKSRARAEQRKFSPSQSGTGTSAPLTKYSAELTGDREGDGEALVRGRDQEFGRDGRPWC